MAEHEVLTVFNPRKALGLYEAPVGFRWLLRVRQGFYEAVWLLNQEIFLGFGV